MEGDSCGRTSSSTVSKLSSSHHIIMEVRSYISYDHIATIGHICCDDDH